jgi:thiol:disulfide interchange protein
MSCRGLIAVVLLLCVSSFAAEVAWVKDYDAALKQAAEQNKFVVLDMSASWCGFCRRMAREVYPDPEFVAFSRSQIFVRLFADTDALGQDLQDKYRVRGFPTILVLNSKGQEVGRLEGARDKATLIRELTQLTHGSKR